LRGQVMNKFSKYVGLDVHQETIAVAVADTAGELRYMGEIVNTPETIAKLVAQIKRGTARVRCLDDYDDVCSDTSVEYLPLLDKRSWPDHRQRAHFQNGSPFGRHA